MTRYLLDTSAFKSISKRQLERAALSRSLFVSPFCFWEVLTHLQDQGDFDRVKGNLMKFRHVEVLEDPKAAIERTILPSDDPVHLKVEDADVIYSTLAALRDSSTMTEFYEKQIADSQGTRRALDGCVRRVNAILESDEMRFQQYLDQVIVAVQSGRVSLASDDDLHQGTLDVVGAWWLQLGGRVPQSQDAFERFVSREYFYSAYIVHRASDYVERRAKVDENDFEDAQLCRHLAVDSSDAVVTADRHLCEAVRNTIGVLNRQSEPSWHTEVSLCPLDEFLIGL